MLSLLSKLNYRRATQDVKPFVLTIHGASPTLDKGFQYLLNLYKK